MHLFARYSRELPQTYTVMVHSRTRGRKCTGWQHVRATGSHSSTHLHYGPLRIFKVAKAILGFRCLDVFGPNICCLRVHEEGGEGGGGGAEESELSFFFSPEIPLAEMRERSVDSIRQLGVARANTRTLVCRVNDSAPRTN